MKDAVPDLDEIMDESGIGLTAALAFWSYFMNLPKRADWRGELALWLRSSGQQPTTASTQ